MLQSASSSFSTPVVNEEVILEQVLDTRRRHKIGVAGTLSQRVHPDTSWSGSRQVGTPACVDLHIEVYLHQSCQQNLHMYENHRIMQQLLAQLYTNIQFLTITRPDPYIPLGHSTRLGPSPPPDGGDDDANEVTNLGDSQLFQIFFFLVFCIKLTFDFINEIK